MQTNPRLSALFYWLIAGAPGPKSFGEMTAEIGRRLQAAGLPIDQLGIYKTMVHPELPGRLDYWTATRGIGAVTLTPEQLRSGKLWIGAPAQVCQETRRMLVYTIGEDARFDNRPDSQALKKRNYVEIVCLPLGSRYTPAVNTATFMTKAPGGFSTEEINALRHLQAPLARVTESFVLHESTVGVLSTYVGRDAGARVLTGNILRGDAELIPAIVLFVDIKGFTKLSNALDAAAVIALLNRFYTSLDAAIAPNGGEILKFMGDGALCIFPTPDDQAAQIAAADGALATLDAVRHALESDSAFAPIGFRAALHLGDVHYGNIGSVNRLDFTVVGPTVNLAARLLDAASAHDVNAVCSGKFAALSDRPTKHLGAETFKGFAEPIDVFALN
jgi:adenylate cyclase